MSEAVRSMFAEISGEYDKMNDVITFGMHKRWRKNAVELSGVKPGMTVLDCASGTGDLAIDFMNNMNSKGTVYATDFCQEMLDYIPNKSSFTEGFYIQQEDVMQLSFADNMFDIASISYGIRNVDDPLVGLQEMARVVKNGGKLVVVETGNPKGIMKLFYNIFIAVLPVLGSLLAKNRSAYEYLPKTAGKFPFGKEFIAIMERTGMLVDCKAYPQFFGATYIYTATIKK